MKLSQIFSNNAVTVTSRDICETHEIHPKSKHALAQRISYKILDKIL